MERHRFWHMWVCQIDARPGRARQIVTAPGTSMRGRSGPCSPAQVHSARGKKIEKGKAARRGVRRHDVRSAELELDERTSAVAITPCCHSATTSPWTRTSPPSPPTFSPATRSTAPWCAPRCLEETQPTAPFTCADLGGSTGLPGHRLPQPARRRFSGLQHGRHLHSGQTSTPSRRSFHCIPDGIFILREDCKPGDDLKPVINADDHVVEFEITPNRPTACPSVWPGRCPPPLTALRAPRAGGEGRRPSFPPSCWTWRPRRPTWCPGTPPGWCAT